MRQHNLKFIVRLKFVRLKLGRIKRHLRRDPFRNGAMVLIAFVVSASDVSADVVIMPFGDSVTAGFHGDPPGSYRQELQTRLEGEGIAYDFVGQYSRGDKDPDHRGHSGAKIEYMIDNFGPAVAQFQPDFVLVLAGTNNHFSVPDFDAFFALYDKLVHTIIDNSPQSSIVISTVPKFGYDRVFSPLLTYWTDEWVDNRNAVTFPNMNAAIYAVADNYPNVEVVDFYSAIDISTDLSQDAVHPNLYGQQKLAKLFGDELLHQLSTVPEPRVGAYGLLLLLTGFARRYR